MTVGLKGVVIYLCDNGVDVGKNDGHCYNAIHMVCCVSNPTQCWVNYFLKVINYNYLLLMYKSN